MAGIVGTMTITEQVTGTVKKIKAAWTAGTEDYAGAASGTTTLRYDGRIIGVTTVPGTAGDAPDDNYDIALNDEDGVDVALGALANRATATTQYVAEASMAGVAKSKLTIAVTAAGSANKGTVYIFIR